MGLFDLLKRGDINRGVEEFLASPNGVLLDVRSRSEYAEGHIPGSVNLDVAFIGNAPQKLKDKADNARQLRERISSLQEFFTQCPKICRGHSLFGVLTFDYVDYYEDRDTDKPKKPQRVQKSHFNTPISTSFLKNISLTESSADARR